ncbi:MAG: hypothetical protein M3N52_09440 [Actinomycetota bacterium]|nr:hypothetical protein [Actinomycetota bacterium]
MGSSHRWLAVLLLLGLLTLTGAACGGEEAQRPDVPPEVQQDVEAITKEVEQRLDAMELRINELEPQIRQELSQDLEGIRQEIRQLQKER